MGSTVRTVTTVLEQIEPSYLRYKLDPKPKADKASLVHITDSNNNICIQRQDSYDQVLPKNEFKFMHYVRKFEKYVGFQTPIRWINATIITVFHILVVVLTIYRFSQYKRWPRWETVLFSNLMGSISGFGVTGGAHRLWCHRSYRVNTPLKIILLICYAAAGQNDLYQWVRDHRVHHKFSETSADPHDANRGFFFSHVGWLMMKKHPDVLREGAKVDMSDLREDPLVRFHTKYFSVFKALCCFIIPFIIPVVLWDESWANGIFANLLRYLLSLHFTWAVNSFAHMFGSKPYDRHIMPVENKFVSMVAMGEGWHNYHHSFPWDYKAAELPYPHNPTTSLINMFAKIGWAYDLKVASPSLIQATVRNRGDPNCQPKKHKL